MTERSPKEEEEESASATSNMDRLTEARLEEIEQHIKQTQPLTSAVLPLSTLEAEYATAEPGTTTFVAGLQALSTVQGYSNVRLIRGDGNCYYRAVLYRLAELVLESPPSLGKRLLATLKESWDRLLALGYDADMLETFYDCITDLFQRCMENKLDAASLHAELNADHSTSDFGIWYLRVLVSGHLKQDPDRFLPFTNGMSMDQFCQSQVEPVGKECEQVQVLALAEALHLPVHVLYLDGHALVNGKVVQHSFGPPVVDDSSSENTVSLHVLYRPGHYDILYPST